MVCPKMMRRFLKDYQELNTIDDVIVEKQEQDGKLYCIVIFQGPKGTFYYGGKFKFVFTFNNYPFSPPTIELKTNIYHILYLNFGVPRSFLSCEFSLQTLGNWFPTRKLQNIIKKIKTMFYYDECIEDEFKKEEENEILRTNKQLYQQKVNEVMVEEYTKQFVPSFIAFKLSFQLLFQTNPDLIFIDFLV